MEYAIIIENAGANFAAYAPDVPGCIATAKTIEEVKSIFAEALTLHLADLAATGQPIPAPASRVAVVEVTSPVAADSATIGAQR